MCNKGLSNCVVHLSMDKEILKQLIFMVIRSEKCTITTFALFWEDHSTDSMIYDLLELKNPVISYFLL